MECVGAEAAAKADVDDGCKYHDSDDFDLQSVVILDNLVESPVELSVHHFFHSNQLGVFLGQWRLHLSVFNHLIGDYLVHQVVIKSVFGRCSDLFFDSVLEHTAN